MSLIAEPEGGAFHRCPGWVRPRLGTWQGQVGHEIPPRLSHDDDDGKRLYE